MCTSLWYTGRVPTDPFLLQLPANGQRKAVENDTWDPAILIEVLEEASDPGFRLSLGHPSNYKLAESYLSFPPSLVIILSFKSINLLKVRQRIDGTGLPF